MLTNTKVNIIKSLNYYDIEILILLNDHRIASISKEKLFSIIIKLSYNINFLLMNIFKS